MVNKICFLCFIKLLNKIIAISINTDTIIDTDIEINTDIVVDGDIDDSVVVERLSFFDWLLGLIKSFFEWLFSIFK